MLKRLIDRLRCMVFKHALIEVTFDDIGRPYSAVICSRCGKTVDSDV